MRLTLLTLALAALPNALGWGKAGHEIIATVAQLHLHPTVMPTLCQILGLDTPGAPPCRLASIAAWADAVRFYKRWSGPLHYIGAVGDNPSATCLFPGQRGWEGQLNVLSGIRNVTDILEGPGAVEDELAEEALKFLVHFLGDLHMPLHLTGRARGGNSIKVLWNGRHTNLHSVWDGLLLAKSLRTLPANYTLPLPISQIEDMLTGTIYDPFIRRVMWEGVMGTWADDLDAWLACPASSSFSGGEAQHVMGALGAGEDTDDDIVCPYAWSAPIHALNCDIVWPPALDQPPYNTSRGSLLQLDTPEYADEILGRRILEKLMAQGGIRLAGILNYLFAQEDEVKAGLWVHR